MQPEHGYLRNVPDVVYFNLEFPVPGQFREVGPEIERPDLKVWFIDHPTREDINRATEEQALIVVRFPYPGYDGDARNLDEEIGNEIKRRLGHLWEGKGSSCLWAAVDPGNDEDQFRRDFVKCIEAGYPVDYHCTGMQETDGGMVECKIKFSRSMGKEETSDRGRR